MSINLSDDQRLYFRDLFREARAKALSNSENFEDLIFTLEKLGKYLYGENKSHKGLSDYFGKINELANDSVLTKKVPQDCPEFHTKFSRLYDMVRDARNSALHEGAFARHLTQHSIEISIILEDALMRNGSKMKDFMVRNPICAYMWQPVSFIRQNMLANSFSYLPVFKDKKWKLISDLEITKYLQDSKNEDEKRERLSRKLDDSCKLKQIKIISTRNVDAEFSVEELLKDWKGLPVCILTKYSNEIVGILTPFDLL